MADTKLPLQTEAVDAKDPVPDDVHIRGVGSYVTLDFKAGTARKTYKPRLAVRLLYWLAFQASFPYSSDRDALEACRQRRVIIGLLTKYWFGIDMVAPVLEIVEEENGDIAFVTRLVEGLAPENKYRARRFLKLLTHHFIEAGLPTWQVSPHNPRSVGNLIEVGDGTYRIIDLESNLVAALTPMSAVAEAIQAKQFPNFDDIERFHLESYLAKHSARIRSKLGSEDYLSLNNASLAYAEYSARWHSREPRIAGRILRIAFIPLASMGRVVRFLKRMTASSQVRAEIFIRRGINHWLHEGWISQEEAQSLRRSLQDEQVATALYHLGTQLALSVPLFFPLSSIQRFTWTTFHRLRAEVRGLITRRPPRAERELHTLLIAVVGLLPFSIGASAYLLSKPLRSNHQLGVIAMDRAVRKLPFKLSRRLKIERIFLRLARKTPKA